MDIVTLLDRFAMAALQGMLSARSVDWDIGDDKLYTAQQAYQYAEAMMKIKTQKDKDNGP